MTDELIAVHTANNKQRSMTDEQVLELWVSWGNSPSDNISYIRAILTNHFFDEIVGYD
jgi:hypothetical protein